MKILVTGASGFIGSNIMRCLNDKGHIVYGCGRKHIDPPNSKYVICNLTRDLPDLKPDVIIHAAAVSPSANVTFNDYFSNNVMATQNILEYAKLNNVKRMIFLGAVSSYGRVDGVLREDSPHNDPDDYGLTKYMAEQLIRNSKIPHYILILPGVVGKGCRDNWIMKAAGKIYNDQQFNYYNGAGLFNNILEIEDLCEFIVRLLETETERSETYLLGAEEKISVEELLGYLRSRLSSSSQLCDISGSRNSFYLDISKALSAGFESKSILEILNIVCNEVLWRGEKMI